MIYDICRQKLLLLGLSLVLGGCADPPAGTEIVFKHGKLTGDPAVMQALLHEFEQEHPGVIVREEVLPASTDQQHQIYAINLDGGRVAFDVLAVDVIWVSEFARAGWIRPLDELVAASRTDYFPAAMQAAVYEGRLYAIPWYVDAGVLYYRRDLLERYGFEPPRTWPDLARMARSILNEEQNPRLKGFVWPGKQYEGLVCAAFEFIWSHGGHLLDRDRRTNAEAALSFLRSLVESGISPALVATSDEEATRLLFGDGRAIFMRNWLYVWSLLQQQDSPVKDRVGVTALPAFLGHPSVAALGGWMLAVPSSSTQPEQAGDLIRFLTSAPIQRRLARELGYRPARLDVYSDADLLAADPSFAAFFPVLFTAKPRPVTPYYLMLSQVLQPAFSAVLVGRQSPKAALDGVWKQMPKMVSFEGAPTHDGAEGPFIPEFPRQ